MMGSVEKQEPTGRERRRQYYIKKLFQLRFISQFCLLLILGFAAFSLSIYLYASQTLTTAFTDSKLRVMSTADFLLPALTLIALVVTGVISFIAAIRLLIFSHKIAGPLYRLEKTAEAIGNGQLNLQVKLRSADELQDFARSMDGMVRDLRTRALAIKRQNDRLGEIVAQAAGAPAVSKELLEALQDAQSQLDQVVRRFQV